MPVIPVRVHLRTNQDKSYTLSLRYTDAFGKDVRQRFCRTEPRCTQRRLRKWMRKAADGAHDLEQQFQGNILDRKQVKWRDLDEGLTEYLAWCQAPTVSGPPNCARGTIANQARHIGQFLKFVRGQMTTERPGRIPLHFMHHIWRNRPATWRDSLIAKGLAAGTINSMLASVAAWYKWAVDHGYAWNNPVAGVLRVKQGPVNRANLPVQAPEELADLLGNMETLQSKVAVMLLAHTGIRQGEAKILRREDVRGDVLHIPKGETETTKLHQRAVPLTEGLVEALAMLESAQPGPYILCTEDGKPLTSQLNRWLEKHGVKPHDLRRFFITAMETIGAPARVIDDLVGHSPGKVRAAYTPRENLEASRPWIREFEKWLDDS